MMARNRPQVLAALALALAAAACSDAAGTGEARLTVALTDAPDSLLQSATVEIGKIEIIPASGSPITLTASGGSADLLALQNGVTKSLATLSIPAGRYLQLRMVVNSATVTLKSPYTFNDGSRTKSLVVPSGAQTGIKINLDAADGEPGAGVDIVPGETILLVDFDVSQNFVVQGAPGTPAGINGYLFTPLLRAVVQNVAGSIAGTLSGASVANRTVRADQVDAGVIEELQTKVATAVSDSAGRYTIRFLAPGTYTVSVPGATTAPASRSVTVGKGQAVTGVDFTIQ